MYAWLSGWVLVGRYTHQRLGHWHGPVSWRWRNKSTSCTLSAKQNFLNTTRWSGSGQKLYFALVLFSFLPWLVAHCNSEVKLNRSYVITPAKEVMFLPHFVCLLVSLSTTGIIKKLRTNFREIFGTSNNVLNCEGNPDLVIVGNLSME